MDDGYKTIEIAMAEWPVENPIPGEYCLTVVADGKTVFEARPVFQEPHISIMSVQFESGNDYYPGNIEGVTV